MPDGADAMPSVAQKIQDNGDFDMTIKSGTPSATTNTSYVISLKCEADLNVEQENRTSETETIEGWLVAMRWDVVEVYRTE